MLRTRNRWFSALSSTTFRSTYAPTCTASRFSSLSVSPSTYRNSFSRTSIGIVSGTASWQTVASNSRLTTVVGLAATNQLMGKRCKGTVKILRLQRQKGKHRFRKYTLCVVLKTQTTTSGRYIYRLGHYDALKRRLVVNLRMVAFVLAKGVQVTKSVYELLLRPHVLIKPTEISYEVMRPWEHPYMASALAAAEKKKQLQLAAPPPKTPRNKKAAKEGDAAVPQPAAK